LSPHVGSAGGFLAKGRVREAGAVNVTLSYAQALEGVEVESSPRVPDAIRVLFVEDDTSVAQMYKLKLELDGCRVDIASDGEMAVEMAGRDLPDIIFLDVRLPKLDGFGVLKALRADSKTKNVRVVIMSNYSRSELGDRATNLDVVDFLMKTETTPAKLTASLPRWLGS
jgi:CheY-like chemotaxis protein